ncbi:unnamed protein product [Adineta ricciae]|uniref:PHD and RING finger domain-containing protein 1 n=1 Tax=Adineta ricciae TaxID=249248 RepID=A0A815NFY9_ADIRI|nr:unnamed protein product [Adineta ricciae]
MSESTSTEEQPTNDTITTNEQPRKYLRRNNDVSTGVTTRSRQREQDQKSKDSESISTDQTMPETISPTEQCAICMENFARQEVGIPENCEHSFCLACLIEWAKKNNSCPIDRKVFRKIFKKHSFTSPKPYDTMKVQDNRLELQLEDNFLEMIDDDITCRVCGRDDQEDLLLICDECGNGYHTFCLELPSVPDTPEWMCPLCEVDRLSATEDLYDDSDLEELQEILLADTVNTTDTELTDTTTPVRQPRVRQTARTGGVRNQRTTSPNARSRRRPSQRRRRRASAPRRQTPLQQQRQRQRRQQTALNNVTRRIERVNAITRNDSVSSGSSNARSGTETSRLSIFDGEPVALDEESSSTMSTNRAIITPSEAARRIAASGIPILTRTQTEPSISRQLSMRRMTPSLDRIPTRTIRPPLVPQARVPISQLPRIQRRANTSTRERQVTAAMTSAANNDNTTNSSTQTINVSFLDNLIHSQERLHNLQNMSVQEQYARYGTPEQNLSLSLVVNRGNEPYDPHSNDEDNDDDDDDEQSTNTQQQQTDSIRTNNEIPLRRIVVLSKSNPSSSSDKSLSITSNEQTLRRRSKSPEDYHRKHSDRRSRSPHHYNYHSSDRKRLHTSSPNTSTHNTVTNDDLSDTEAISSSKYRKSSRNDNRADSKQQYRERVPVTSSSLKLPSTSNKRDSYSNHRSSKRDDYHTHRNDSSRDYHSHSSSKYSSRDYSSSLLPYQSSNDRRTLSSKVSDAPRVSLTTPVSDGYSARSYTESIQRHSSTEKQTCPETKLEPAKPSVNSTVASKVESTSINGSAKSIGAPKTNGSAHSNVPLKEELLDKSEEKKPKLGKSVDLDSLTLIDTSVKQIDTKEEPVKTERTMTTAPTAPVAPVPITTTAAATAATTVTSVANIAPITSSTPSPTKKPYTLYKVPHTNHMTPPLSSRHKKQAPKQSPNTSTNSTNNITATTATTATTTTTTTTTITTNSSTDNNSRTSLDERISTMLSGSTDSSNNKSSNSTNDHNSDSQANLPIPTITTPSDKSTDSPQDVNLLISATVKKGHEPKSLTKQLHLPDERRSTTSKHYTSEWLASQKPEEAQPEDLSVPTSLKLPTLISSQSSITTGSGETTMYEKLSEAMTKLLHKKVDPNATTTETTEEAVPISAKHLERLERRKERKKRQTEIAIIAKEALKPAFKKRGITKEEYKIIMKKVVTKATDANEVDRTRIRKMIHGYVTKYRTEHERNTSKISNGNGS